MLAATWWLACAGAPGTPSPPVETGSTVPDTGSRPLHTGIPPGGHSSATPVDPPDTEILGRGLQAAVDVLQTLTMAPCYDAWDLVSADKDLGCPDYFIFGADQVAWEDICVTAAGTTYGGILTTTFDQADYVQQHLVGPVMDRFAEELLPGWTDGLPFEGSARTGIGLDGSVAVHLRGSVDPDFVFGGQGSSARVASRDLTLLHHSVEGLCTSSVAPRGSWVEAGISPWLDLNQLSTAGVEGFLTQVNGSVGGLPAPVGSASFEELTLRPTTLPGTHDPDDPEPPPRCDLEPSGALELREDSGRVWRVTFDPEASCDGCGRLTASDSTPFGELCADFSSMNRPLADPVPTRAPRDLPGLASRTAAGSLFSPVGRALAPDSTLPEEPSP